MNKTAVILSLALLAGVACSACSQRKAGPAETPPQVIPENSALPELSPSPVPVPAESLPESNEPSGSPTPSPEPPVPQADAGVDVDLTAMSTTVAYSEVYSISLSPEEYAGKTIRVRGQFVFHEDPKTGTRHFACVIPDATACCVQGFEFVPVYPEEYPDGYPEPNAGKEITVTGKIDTYEENGTPYAWITGAMLEASAP